MRRQAEVKRRTCRSAARPSAAKKKRLKQQYLRKDSSGSCKIYPPCAQRVAEHRKKLIGDVSKKLRRAAREARRRKLRKASRRDRGKCKAAKIREPAALQALRKHLRRAELVRVVENKIKAETAVATAKAELEDAEKAAKKAGKELWKKTTKSKEDAAEAKAKVEAALEARNVAAAALVRASVICGRVRNEALARAKAAASELGLNTTDDAELLLNFRVQEKTSTCTL